MDTSAKGEIAFHKVCLRALEKGMIISRPLREDSRYDAVLDDKGRLYRAQIKYVDNYTCKGERSIRIKLERVDRKNPRGYNSSEIDVLLVYVPKLDTIYWLPVQVWENKNSVYLCVRVDNKNYPGHKAVDYVW